MTRRDPRGWAASQWKRDLHRARVERQGPVIDPRCHFAVMDPEHDCYNSFGAPLQPGQSCFAQSSFEAANSGAVLREAERAAGGEG